MTVTMSEQAATLERTPSVADVQLEVVEPIEIGAPSSTAMTMKRVIDVSIASLALIVFAPVMAVIAIIIKATSRGPVLFRQERMGQGGELFTLTKFRSMRDGTHGDVLADEEALRQYVENDFKLPSDDPRITAIGRFLRKTSLDELPQLVHVVRGEMSLVGIRPLLAMEVAQRSPYDQACYKLLKPGMTGLWQVEGRSSIAHEDRYSLDRRYVEDWSVGGDIGLLLRTPLAVVRVGATQ